MNRNFVRMLVALMMGATFMSGVVVLDNAVGVVGWPREESLSSLADGAGSSTATSIERAHAATSGYDNDQPQRLIISSIGVDAAVQPVGVTRAGAMATPKPISAVGWYRYGRAPGEVGSSVLVGHVDNGLGLAGVFKKLRTLEKGDRAIVAMQGGSRVTFEVVSTSSYPYKKFPSEEIFSVEGESRLTLVTCEGVWLPTEKTYSNRLVVRLAMVAR